jgi:hypothetical protein
MAFVASGLAWGWVGTACIAETAAAGNNAALRDVRSEGRGIAWLATITEIAGRPGLAATRESGAHGAGMESVVRSESLTS